MHPGAGGHVPDSGNFQEFLLIVDQVKGVTRAEEAAWSHKKSVGSWTHAETC